MSSPSEAIGGYLELGAGASSCADTAWLPAGVPASGDSGSPVHTILLQSARSAFHFLLQLRRPSAVWLPRLICDTMHAPPTALGIPVRFYSVQENLELPADLTPGVDELVLLVDYFGLGHGGRMARLAARFNPGQVIIDCSQAWYAKPPDALAALYSPRKFHGVPDGGVLSLRTDLLPDGLRQATKREHPTPADEKASLARCEHLLIRLGQGAEAGYAAYQRAESSLKDTAPQEMSMLTRTLLARIDYDSARRRRQENFDRLHAALGTRNRLQAASPANTRGPLCYPFLLGDDPDSGEPRGPALRSRLIGKRIFVPTYWPEVQNRAGISDFEYRMVRSCLPLPCDHRYGAAEMDRIIELMLA